MASIKENKQPCAVCRNHKGGKPFKIRDDNGKLFSVSHICNCPYCGRFLSENYTEHKEAEQCKDLR